MEIHQLKAFDAVASTGGFSRAAKKCHIAQPSLSKAIQRLEAEIGEKLFTRLKRRAVLTATGEILQKRVRRILNEIDEVRREVSETQGLMRGAVSIGVLPTIAPYFLPGVIGQFLKSCPTLEIVAHEDVTANLLKLIDECEIDLALLSLPVFETGLEKEVLFKEELLLAVPQKHPFAAKDSVSVCDLENERFILMKEAHCLGDQVFSFCTQSTFRFQITLRSSQVETIHSLVVSGLGISLIPQMARIKNRPSLVYRSLEAPKPTRTIVVVWRKGRDHSRAMTEFLKHLRQHAKAWTENFGS